MTSILDATNLLSWIKFKTFVSVTHRKEFACQSIDCFRQWVVIMNPDLITCNYYWQNVSTCLLLRWWNSAQIFFSGCFFIRPWEFLASTLCRLFCSQVLPSLATTAGLPVSITAHSSPVLMRPSFQISTSVFSVVSLVVVVAALPLRGLSPRLFHRSAPAGPVTTSFSPLLKWWNLRLS
jgi:hypothetical protein